MLVEQFRAIVRSRIQNEQSAAVLTRHVIDPCHQVGSDAPLSTVAPDDQPLNLRTVPPVLLCGKHELNRADNGVVFERRQDHSLAERRLAQALVPVRVGERLVERRQEADRRAIVDGIAKEGDQFTQPVCAPVRI